MTQTNMRGSQARLTEEQWRDLMRSLIEDVDGRAEDDAVHEAAGHDQATTGCEDSDDRC